MLEKLNIPEFRGIQKEICLDALSNLDLSCVLPTGGGKSLLYLLPALVQWKQHGKVTVIIYPITQLIEDQNKILPSDSRVYYGARKDNLDIFATDNTVAMIMTTPDSLLNPKSSVAQAVKYLVENDKLARFVVDESHAVTDWLFRDSYCKIGELRKTYPDIPFTLCTATLNSKMEAMLFELIGIDRHTVRTYREPENRPNLHLYVRPKPLGEKADEQLVNEIVDWIFEFHKDELGIVYTRTIKDANKVAEMLREKKISAQPFHSKLAPLEKEKIMNAWKVDVDADKRVQVVVATIAFGLGINCVRCVFIFTCIRFAAMIISRL
jgi:bloom syndrome protein